MLKKETFGALGNLAANELIELIQGLDKNGGLTKQGEHYLEEQLSPHLICGKVEPSDDVMLLNKLNAELGKLKEPAYLCAHKDGWGYEIKSKISEKILERYGTIKGVEDWLKEHKNK